MEANKADNRLQIFFDGKPDEGTRDELKANGFRWAPSVGAWQRGWEKPSIRAQLKSDRAQAAPKPKQKEKEQEARRSVRQALEME